MGRGIYIIVAGSIAFGAMIMFTNRQTDIAAALNKGRYGNQVVAREIAKSGASRGLSEVRRELMGVTRNRTDVPVSGGKYDLGITDSGYGNLQMSSTGKTSGEEHEITTNLLFEAPVEAAIFLQADTVGVSESGSFLVSGHDTRLAASGGGQGYLRPIAALQVPPSSLAAVSGSATGSNYNGDGGAGAIASISNAASYDDIIVDAISNADYAISNPVSGTYGTAESPAVVHVSGDFAPTGSFTGAGVLVVENGDFAPTGPFDWNGLVVVQQASASSSDVKLTTGTSIVGGLVAINSSSGTASVPNPGAASCAIPWTIDGPFVDPQVDYIFQVDVLGSEIQRVSEGVTQYEVPVTAEVHMGSQDAAPFGPMMAPLQSTINGNPSFRPNKIFKGRTKMSLSAASWQMITFPGDQTDPANWELQMHQDTRLASDHIEVLKDGDTPPSVAGFNGQVSAEDLLAPYLANGQVSIGANQALFLFELAETNRSNPAYDLNDFVALVTLAPAPAGLEVTSGESIDHVTSGITIEVCPSTQTTVNVPSEITLEIGGGSNIVYSAEAIAKAGQSLQSIRNRTMVVVTSEEESQD